MKATGIISFLVIAFLAVGEIKCIVKFIKCDFEPDYKAEVVYGIGLISYGPIIGWCNVGEHSKK